MYWDALGGHAGLGWDVLGALGCAEWPRWTAWGCTGLYWGALGCWGVFVPAQKGKSRAAGAKSKPDKSRTPVRAQTKKTPKTPGRAPSQRTPTPDEEPLPPEPLDVEPILDDLLERVLTESLCLQRVPFTVSRARDAILFVAEWRFLVRDDGDPDPERDGVWNEDEEPQTSHWDSSTPGVVPERLKEVRRPPEPVPAVTAPCQPPSAAAAAPSAQDPGTATAVPRPKPPIAPQPPGRSRRLSRLPLARPPARPSAVPSQPRAPAPRQPRRTTATVHDRMPPPPPPPSPRISLAWVQPQRSSRGTRVPRLGTRRDAVRWLLPEVRVVDVTTEPDRVRPVGSRTRLITSGTRYVPQTAGRTPKGEPQLCDPWLASARLAPGVTVRWGSSERRGPPPPGHSAHGESEPEEDEAMRRAKKELKPILPTPESRFSEFSDGEEQQELPEVVPAVGVPPALWGPSVPRVLWVPEMVPATTSVGTSEYRSSSALMRKIQK
uniref:Uncharacterized protein n=1 Tax=Catharus ustulatus TaxID=91951 RepID=A0A8C3TZR4_CATUS